MTDKINMSSETSSGSFEVVDLQVKFQGERSYYPSQHPVDSTERIVQLSSQERLSSHGPTECTSGVTTAEITTLELPKVEELARNLVIATKENDRYRIAMEDCNKVLSKEVEAAEDRNREIENLKAMLESFRLKNTELEESNKSLQEQLSIRVCCSVFVMHTIKAQGKKAPGEFAGGPESHERPFCVDKFNTFLFRSLQHCSQ